MRIFLVLLVLATPAAADSLVALRTIPARSVIAAADMTLVDADIAGAVTDPVLIIGQEARVAVFAGRPIRAADFVAPALVDRNQLVSLSYDAGGLTIVTEGRAMERAGAGEVVRVMNLTSRATVFGTVTGPGVVQVGPSDE